MFEAKLSNGSKKQRAELSLWRQAERWMVRETVLVGLSCQNLHQPGKDLKQSQVTVLLLSHHCCRNVAESLGH